MAQAGRTTRSKITGKEAPKKASAKQAKHEQKASATQTPDVTNTVKIRKPNFSVISNFFQTRTKTKITSIVVLVLVAAGLVLFGNRVADAFQRTVGVAVVNGQVISKSELEHRLVQSYGSDMTSSLVDETLVLQEGQKEHINIAQKDVDSQISKIEQQIAPQKLDDALSQRHLTRDDLVRQIHIQLIVEKVLGKDIKISDSDVQTYFDQNKDTLAQQSGKNAADLKIEDVKSTIESNLRSSQISAKYQAWIEGLRSKANIKTFI